MHRLRGRIQPYAWGGNNFIPDLFHLKTDRSTPAAEYWLGAHPGGVTEVEMEPNKWVSLADAIDASKSYWLGKKITEQFGRLPFLLKVLDVKDMLSIQVHPNKQSAEIGYKHENEKGIPLDAPHRNYKDDNHKPEVMIALSEFWLLHGFAEDIEDRLSNHPFLHPFIPVFEKGGIEALYSHLMQLTQEEVNQIISPLASTIIPAYRKGELSKSSPDFWAARAIENLCKNGHFDRGIFSIYLFNILRLNTGDGIFQGAGMPHAYLEGQNIELMSNSDNVLRAGLTPKFIDIPELLKNTLFNVTIPKVIKAQQTEEQIFDCPVPDFNIRSLHLLQGKSKLINSDRPTMLLMIQGKATLQGDRQEGVESAAAYFIPPGKQCMVQADTDLVFVLASVD